MAPSTTTYNAQTSETLPEWSDKSKVEYELEYFPIHFNSVTARNLLIYGGVKYTDTTPTPSWEVAKVTEPFEALPVLTIRSRADPEQSIQIGEVVAIDTFLAKQFNLLGSDDVQTAVIMGYYSGSYWLYLNFILKVFWAQPSAKTAELENFMTKTLVSWVRVQEKHLQANGANGHYIENRTTLADIRVVSVLEALYFLIGEKRLNSVVNTETAPAILKVVEVFKKNTPAYVAWKESEAYAEKSKITNGQIGSVNPHLLE